jgi:sulfatase maturation enzyme AslB (radical SAM superfamily)
LNNDQRHAWVDQAFVGQRGGAIIVQPELVSQNGGTVELQFLWVELTNQCNLQCSHCYAESGPNTSVRNALSSAQYRQLIFDAYENGCRQIQFIGGEPTLNPDLPALIQLCSALGYSFVEVFTNLTRLSDELVACFKQNGVHVATSVYASSAEIHDTITHLAGSFAHTVRNIRRLSEAKIPIRAGIIEMLENAGQVESTTRFLNGLGVQKIGTDRVRHFGRGGTSGQGDLGELCGQCADNILCVGSDGKVSPCIMSKLWSVGSLLDSPLNELITSAKLMRIRGEIYRATVQRRKDGDGSQEDIHAICDPKTCGPYSTCTPTTGPGPCGPSGCTPCFPKG